MPSRLAPELPLPVLIFRTPTRPQTMSFLFATTIENGYPTVEDGHRIDVMDLSGHYARWEEDFGLVRELGLDTLRWGPAYYRMHVGPDAYDWEICDEPMHRLRALGITPIVTLCQFGVPSWLEGFQDPAFPVLFAEYARAFARRYPWVRHFTPIERITVSAVRSTLSGEWNERLTDERAFAHALRNLCMAHELAVEAIAGERPDATFVHVESLERDHAAGAGAAREAEHRNALRQLALDLTLGLEPAPRMTALLHAHGVTSNDLSFFRERRVPQQRWLGVRYRPEHERRVTANGKRTIARQALGFRRLATESWRRYALPLLVESTREGRRALPWLRTHWSDTLALRAAGVPIVGFSWGALTDGVGLATFSGRTRTDGLADHARRLRPVGVAYRETVARWRDVVSMVQGEDDREALA